jgi:hypothetical protein
MFWLDIGEDEEGNKTYKVVSNFHWDEMDDVIMGFFFSLLGLAGFLWIGLLIIVAFITIPWVIIGIIIGLFVLFTIYINFIHDKLDL